MSAYENIITENQIRQAISQCINTLVGEINEDQQNDINILLGIILSDSLQAINFVILLEDEFNIEFDDDDINIEFFSDIDVLTKILYNRLHKL